MFPEKAATADVSAWGLPMSYMRPWRRTPTIPLRLRTEAQRFLTPLCSDPAVFLVLLS